ncbi:MULTISPECIES: FAD-dependent oxidoreductase [Roseateles]|uniref:FAD-dependent oxidoreductase n=1 Tax=Pelomonas caseinilytica TaxID=2906763 RepID=A0ABS8XAY2_9BURK|nr:MULTISPECIES: FAD-dependent oxidoreductase [unclassified Roseateles]MCE4536028.1 FAD-dependent oxidoreductase [Pelomonas sp. P7]HEV6966242.1 FAD-dependent oxidoreductase [Roseateles sp.]
MSNVLPYLVLAALAVSLHLYLRHRRERKGAAVKAEVLAAGLNEPPSLHPIVDPIRCIGSGGCTHVCPEGALGIVAGKAELINAAACIGHGACAAACPVEAIQLVFGTERRGVDIPRVDPHFESNVPGLFIAGELGGMGLIRKAAAQGVQAVDSIRRRGRAPADRYDVVIIGAGPAGLGAALAAQAHGLRYVVLEQEDSLGGSVYHYPRAKIAMTAPVTLPLVGQVRMSEVSKEKLLAFWQEVVERHGLKLSFKDAMQRVEPDGTGFVVHATRGDYRTQSVLLAIGRRGSPRKLGCPGEELPNVVYRLIDAEQYRGRRVLVVGGGDSALEAAVQLSEQPGTTVRLAYRSAAFNRVKVKNRQALEAAVARGRVALHLNTEVASIDLGHVSLSSAGTAETVDNDDVIVCAGGVLPTPLLQAMGIAFDTKHGTA